MFKSLEYKSLESHVTFYFVNKLDLESVSPGCQLLSFVDHCDSGLKVHLWESVQETWIPLLSRKGIELSPLNLDLKKMEVFPSWDTCTTWKRSLALRFCRLHQLSSNVPERWKYSDGRGFFFSLREVLAKCLIFSESVSSSVKLEFILPGPRNIISSAIIMLKPFIYFEPINLF